MNVNGYETKTTFWQDFSIAEAFGPDAIQDTFDRAFKGWKSNAKYLTELVLVLNWKLGLHYENGRETLARLYDKLWKKADSYAVNNLKDKDLEYFLATTD